MRFWALLNVKHQWEDEKKREGIITKMNNEKHGIDTGFTLRPIKHMYQIIENCNKSKLNNWSNSI